MKKFLKFFCFAYFVIDIGIAIATIEKANKSFANLPATAIQVITLPLTAILANQGEPTAQTLIADYYHIFGFNTRALNLYQNACKKGSENACAKVIAL